MSRRPATILYGLNDRPPLGVLFLLAIQHNFLMASTVVLPVALMTEIGGGDVLVRQVVGLSMIAAGIGTIVQAIPRIGSGYLCPNLVGPNFFAACTQAAWIGGIPLMRGMTLFAGMVEMLMAPVLRRVRFLFPIEIIGLVVFLVGVGLVPLGSSKFLGIDYSGDPIRPAMLAVAACTLLIMAGLHVWGGKRLRPYSVVAGLLVGYGLSLALGLFTPTDFNELDAAPWLALPFLGNMLQVHFSASLMLPFAIAAVCGSLKTMGNLISAQKINDEEWAEPDMKNVSRGIFADSLSLLSAGLLGGLATDSSSGNVGLSQATGATSRIIGIVAGALLILYGFSPKVTAVLSLMPEPVMGAIVAFVACFMMLSGLQIMLSVKLEQRMILVLGLALISGLSLDMLPQMYALVPPWLAPVFQSSLTLGTLVAIVLNQVLRDPAAAKP